MMKGQQNERADIKSLDSFVWSIAELLRGDVKQSEYSKVVLPFVVLRKLDCILEKINPPFSKWRRRYPSTWTRRHAMRRPEVNRP